MSSFDLGLTVERRGMAALLPHLKQVSGHGGFSLTNKGPLSRYVQDTLGDVVLNTPDGKMWWVEIKIEETNKTGNLFLETWSNLNFQPRKVGWIYTQSADILWYYFIEQDNLYSIDNHRLFEWAHVTPSKVVRGGMGRLYDYPQKPQGKYTQMNQTYGRCVPIRDIEKEVGFRVYHPFTRRGNGPHVVGLLPGDVHEEPVEAIT